MSTTRPSRPAALERAPKAQTDAERAFLQIGPGAAGWLTKAAAAGTVRVRRKMAEAVDLAKLHGRGAVDQALPPAAAAQRFDEGAIASILAHHQPLARYAKAGAELQRVLLRRHLPAYR